ncbi:hypothetical protein F5884DRAFT_426262 [Xylogone sp. PMI_703]|nr:hypothetical protein F5884DRAFT_426262 [Xylogone sp. PMI_703]
MAGLGSPTISSPTSPSFTLDAHHLSPERHYPNRKRAGSSNASSRALLHSALGPGRAYYGHRPKTASTSSRNTQSSRSTTNRTGQRDVRTLPPWIDSVEDDDDDEEYTNSPSERLLSSLSKTHSAEHHYNPSKPTRRISQDGYVDDYEDGSNKTEERKETGFFGGHREPERGRKWDHARVRDPIIMQETPIQSSTWRNYIQASMYGPALEEEGEKVEPRFLEEQTPGYQRPWRGDMGTSDGPDNALSYFQNEKKRRNLYKRLQHHLIMHPLVPLIFRLIVLCTSTIALGLSASVYYLSKKYDYLQNPSTIMAIVVDIVAVPYILYITWDEYTGKPLGLRSPRAKIRLVLLDLFFIIFESANLALAFAALTDNDGSCTVSTNGYNFVICGRVKALCGILMGALIAWGLTFTVSIFRLVERVGGREDHP